MRRAFFHPPNTVEDRMGQLDPDSLVVETFAPAPDEGDWAQAARCTGCVSTCGILPP